jgi:hypothetical protein
MAARKSIARTTRQRQGPRLPQTTSNPPSRLPSTLRLRLDSSLDTPPRPS